MYLSGQKNHANSAHANHNRYLYSTIMKISPKKKNNTVGGVDLKQIGGQNRDANANDDVKLNKQQSRRH